MRRSPEEWLAVADEYVRACFGRGSVPRVDELAASLGVSREELSRRFRAATGLAPAAEFRRVQLRRAQELLAATRQSTADIARATAHGSTRAFYRAFLRGTGVTPTAWRQKISST